MRVLVRPEIRKRNILLQEKLIILPHARIIRIERMQVKVQVRVHEDKARAVDAPQTQLTAQAEAVARVAVIIAATTIRRRAQVQAQAQDQAKAQALHPALLLQAQNTAVRPKATFLIPLSSLPAAWAVGPQQRQQQQYQ